VASQLIEEVTAHAQSDSLEDAREICADGTYFPNNLRIKININNLCNLKILNWTSSIIYKTAIIRILKGVIIKHMPHLNRQIRYILLFYRMFIFWSVMVCRCVCTACLCYNALPTRRGNTQNVTMKTCQRRQVDDRSSF